MKRTVLLVLAFFALLTGAILLYRTCRVPSPPPEVALLDAGAEAPCADGLTPIAGGGCFAAPIAPVGPVTLLVYLHGRYSPKTLADELDRQHRVARLATSKGFAVLALRGVQGECTQAELADHWCWPSNPRNADHGVAFVARFEPAVREARGRIGAGPSVLLGFSNGAYFAALIAARALFPFDAVAIAHGGPVAPTHPAGATPPLLLITADDDPSDPEMQELDAELTHEHWLHEYVARDGGHALPDWDIATALTFFTRTRKERLPLAPPLQPPRPRPTHASEGGVDAPKPTEAPATTPVETPYDDAN
jgi:predicted esterase